MKRSIWIVMGMIFFFCCAVNVHADVNEILTFTNFTDEELYVEMSVFDDTGEQIFDIYVVPNNTSVVDFWADTVDATYRACAYGEITTADYGCIAGGISDYDNHVYFDFSGAPYASGPSGLPEEWFVFDSPYSSADTLAVNAEVHTSGSGGCFIGLLF